MDEHLNALENAVQKLVVRVDALCIYPRKTVLLDRVSLGMVSKAVRLFQAVLSLVRQGFFEEAYALSRSSVELRINARWIANQVCDRRAHEFFFFGAKQINRLNELASAYMLSAQPQAQKDDRLERVSKLYKNHKRWTNAHIAEMAKEPSTRQLTEQGIPTTFTQTFETVYWNMCSFCHIDIAALMYGDHVPSPGSPFVVSKSAGATHHGAMAALASCLSVYLATEYALEAMNMPVPQDLQDLFVEVLALKITKRPSI